MRNSCLMDARPGTYALILRAVREERLQIGRRGQLLVQPGWYVYVGSAFGPGGVRARVRHHCRIAAAPHWHIDYLRRAVEIEAVWYTHDPHRQEHVWADIFRQTRGAGMPLPGFGASDCGCVSHLFFFPLPPSQHVFRRRLGKLYPRINWGTNWGTNFMEDTMTQSQANQEQSQYWNEQAGPKWVRRQAQLDTQIQPLGLAAMQHADIKPGERVLDIGCGCGQTALELAERVGSDGAVLGADLSQPMLARAQERQRERKLNNLEFVQADAQIHAFAQAHFDLVFSRFGVMFFADPAAAFRNLQTALKPDGRLCFLCWQPLAQNDWVKIPLGAAAQHVALPPPPVPGTPGPFSLGDPDRIREVLGAAGFASIGIEPHETDLNLGGAKTVDEAVTFLLEIGPMVAVLRDAEEAVRQRAIEAVQTALRPYASPDGVQLRGATWIVTARPAR